ncbi:MAG: nitrilase-related carbon-nitrogen hydrolase [Gaiellaceae bacterium]
MEHRISGAWMVVAAIATGALLFAAAPFVGVGVLAWFALVPVAATAMRLAGTRTSRWAIPLAYVVYLELLLIPALPFGLTRNQWGDDPVVPILIGDSPVLITAIVILPLAGLALYLLRFPFLVRLRSEAGPNWVSLVAIPSLAFAALDFLRASFEPGGLWGPLFASQEDTAALRLAELGGPALVSLAIAFANFSLAYGIIRGRRALPALATAGACALAATVGLALSGSAERTGTVTVAAIQPGYDTAQFELPVLSNFRQPGRDDELGTLDLIADLAPLTEEAAADGATLVVWPEATGWADPFSSEPTRTALRELVTRTGTTLVVPYFLRARSHGATVIVGRDGTISRAQPKQRTMWFLGEKSDNRVPPAPVVVDGLAIGTMLGVDSQNASIARDLVNAGADLLTSSTHDWEQLAPQHAAFARVAAVSLDVPIVRADWRNVSAIYKADGSVAASTGRETRRAIAIAQIETGAGSTAYGTIGGAVGWLAVGFVGAAFAVRVGVRVRVRRKIARARPAPA